MSRILFVAPHYDDETLAAAATLHKLAKQGHKVFVFGLTLSDAAFIGQSPNLGEKRKEAEKACEVLGVELVHRVPLVQRDMHVSPRGETIKSIIKMIRVSHSDIVITTHPNCFHCDHRSVSIASKEAVYQAPRKGILGSETEMDVKPILLFGEVDLESISPMKTHVVSVVSEEDIQAKVKALKCYAGFIGEHDSVCSTDHGETWIRSLAHIRGLHFGVEFAEVFEIGNIHSVLEIEDLL